VDVTPERAKEELDLRDRMFDASQRASKRGKIGHFPPATRATVDAVRYATSVVDHARKASNPSLRWNKGTTMGVAKTNQRLMLSFSGSLKKEQQFREAFNANLPRNSPHAFDITPTKCSEKACAARKWQQNLKPNEKMESSMEAWLPLGGERNDYALLDPYGFGSLMKSCRDCKTDFPYRPPTSGREQDREKKGK
jgi:hypothetical protein